MRKGKKFDILEYILRAVSPHTTRAKVESVLVPTMNFAGNRTPGRSKKLVAAIAVVAVAGAIGVVLFLRSRGVTIPFFPTPQVQEETTEGLGSASFEKANNPVKGELPDNPFAGETNPFEGGTNAVEKSYDNPLK